MVEKIIDDICNAIEEVAIDLVLHLPCGRISALLQVMAKRFTNIPLTREEEGVGIAAGAVLAGAKPLMVVQSSGMGNMVNALLSLTQFYQIPLPIFISQRGIYKENVAAQIPVGSRLPKILDAMEIENRSYSEPEGIIELKSKLENTFAKNKINCFLLSPKLFEGQPKPKVPMLSELAIQNGQDITSSSQIIEEIIEDAENPRSRFDILAELTEFLREKAVVCNMGFPARELYSISDQASNFYMLGSLGLASSIGLGVAMFTRKDVIVIDGDGSILMNPNALISIAAVRPRNLSVICIDNGVFGSTGNQPTRTANGMKLEQLAKAVGFKRILVTDNPSSILDFYGPGPNFVRLRAKPGNAKIPTIGISAIEIKERFQAWLQE